MIVVVLEIFPGLQKEKMKMNGPSLCIAHNILHPQSRRVQWVRFEFPNRRKPLWWF